MTAGRRYDLERVVDDFVLLCYFVGNDFLPHLPTMDINTGGLNALIRIYKRLMPGWKGFLTDAGDVHLGRLQDLLVLVGKTETEMFRKRAVDQVSQSQPGQTRRRGGAHVDTVSGGVATALGAFASAFWSFCVCDLFFFFVKGVTDLERAAASQRLRGIRGPCPVILRIWTTICGRRSSTRR